MGFGKGSLIANDIWHNIRHLISPSHRKAAAKAIIDALEKCDWDTQLDSQLLLHDAGVLWDQYDQEGYLEDAEDESEFRARVLERVEAERLSSLPEL